MALFDDVFFDRERTVKGPRRIERDGMVGFRNVLATFEKDSQTVAVKSDDVTVYFSVIDFLNLMDQASWYFDEVVSREEK